MMSEYTGSRCPVCKKKFTDEDDIVVCPTCGAPHHRECYNELGECAFEDEHITGKAWTPTKPISTQSAQQPARQTSTQPSESSGHTPYPNMGEPATQSPRQQRQTGRQGSSPSESGKLVCNSCGTENPDTNLFCNLCGNWLGEGQSRGQTMRDAGTAGGQSPMGGVPFSQLLEQQMQYDPRYALYGGLSPDEPIGEHTAHDVATYVGKSSSHYVPRFKAISDNNSTFTPNFSALMFHGFYFLYRKMYAIGAILLVIFIISTIPTVLYTREAMLYNMYLDEVGVDSQGQPVVPYDDVAKERLQRYELLDMRTRMVFFLISAVTSFMANRLYYEHSMRKISKVLEPIEKEEPSHGKCVKCDNALAKAGGVSIAAVVISIVVIVLGISGYLAYHLFLS